MEFKLLCLVLMETLLSLLVLEYNSLLKNTMLSHSVLMWLSGWHKSKIKGYTSFTRAFAQVLRPQSKVGMAIIFGSDPDPKKFGSAYKKKIYENLGYALIQIRMQVHSKNRISGFG